MSLSAELKRKAFHHLSFFYILIYAILPRPVAIGLMLAFVAVAGAAEFLRLRRPEMNAWFLERFDGIYREDEIMKPSGIFWTLLGCAATMIIFASPRVILPALGFLTFGDAAAALAGKRWGRIAWGKTPGKTREGSIAFVIVSAVWGCFFLRPVVALLSAVAGAWVELQQLPWNDNFWIPLLGGLAVSVINLLLGKH
jgi:dolichol kinase